MIKKITSLSALFLLCLLVQAQDAKSLFVNMPDSLAPLFTKVNRADFADFLDSNMKAQVKNRLDDNSEMKKLSKDYLLIQTSELSTFQLKLLPLTDSIQVICTVTTVCGPACDSRFQFYTTDWKILPAGAFITLPTTDSFLQQSDSASTDDYAYVLARMDMLLLKADLSDKDRSLVLSYTTPDYLNKGEKETVQSFIKQSTLNYEWKDGKFLLIN